MTAIGNTWQVSYNTVIILIVWHLISFVQYILVLCLVVSKDDTVPSYEYVKSFQGFPRAKVSVPPPGTLLALPSSSMRQIFPTDRTLPTPWTLLRMMMLVTTVITIYFSNHWRQRAVTRTVLWYGSILVAQYHGAEIIEPHPNRSATTTTFINYDHVFADILQPMGQIIRWPPVYLFRDLGADTKTWSIYDTVCT